MQCDLPYIFFLASSSPFLKAQCWNSEIFGLMSQKICWGSVLYFGKETSFQLNMLLALAPAVGSKLENLCSGLKETTQTGLGQGLLSNDTSENSCHPPFKFENKQIKLVFKKTLWDRLVDITTPYLALAFWGLPQRSCQLQGVRPSHSPSPMLFSKPMELYSNFNFPTMILHFQKTLSMN